MSDKNNTSLLLGNYTILGNSDYLHNFEQAKIFESTERITVGLSGQSTQLFSDSTNNGVTSIFGFELPNIVNNNVNLQSVIPITDQDKTFEGYSIMGYDVIQNPAIPFYNDQPSTHLIVYASQSGSPAVLFKSDPMNSGSEPATNPFKLLDGADINKIKGFFATYAGLYEDKLEADISGIINIYVQNQQGEQELLSLSNYDYTDIFPVSVLDFAYTYYQDNASTDYLVLAFLMNMSDGNNTVKLLAYNRQNQAEPTRTSLEVQFEDGFNPTCLSGYQTGNSAPELYVGGNCSGGYKVFQLDAGYDPGQNNLTPELSLQFTANTKGQLERFHIGKVNDSQPNDCEFWGIVNYNQGSAKMLTNAQCQSSSWSKPLPLLQITKYNYLCDRVSGSSSIFVCPAPNQSSNIPSLLDFNDITANSLIHIWTDVESKQIKSMPVKLPDNTVRKYGASASYLTFSHNAGTSNKDYPINLQIKASQKTFVEINGVSMQIGTENVPVQTTATGKLSIIRETTALASESFIISIEGETDELEVDTRANSQSYLSTRKVQDNDAVNKANAQLAQVAQDKGGNLMALSILSSKLSVGTKLNPAHYCAISFVPDGSSKFFASDEEFRQHKSSGASSTPMMGDGLLDDIFDDFVNAWGDLENDISKFCAAAENFLDQVTDIVVNAENMLVYFGQKFATLVLTDLEDVWDAIKFVLNKVIDAINDAISFLGAFFEILETIPSTTRAISTILNCSLTQLKSDLQSDVISANIRELLGKITGNPVQNPSASTPSNADQAHNTFSNNSAINYIITHIEQALSGSGGESLFTIGHDAVSFAENAADTLSDVVKGIYDIITNLGEIDQQFNDLSTKLSCDIQCLMGDLENLITDLFQALAKGLEQLISLLQDTTYIPILSEVFDFLTGEEFSLINLVSLIISVPTTVLYGIVKVVENGSFSAPFEQLDLDRINTFQDLLDQLYAGSGVTPVSTLLPFVSSSETISNQSAIQLMAESSENSTLDDFAKVFGFAGLANSFLDYFLFAMDKLKEGYEKSKYEYAFNASSLVFLCINSGFSISRSESKGVVGFVSGMKAIKGMLSFVSPEAESDKHVVSGLQGFFSVFCLSAFLFSNDEVEDTLTIIHPTIDYIADFALEHKDFEASLIIELIALGITFVELMND